MRVFQLDLLSHATYQIAVRTAEWSGINALLYYGPTLVAALGARGGSELIISGGIGIAQLVAVIPAVLYIDDLGRKTMLRGGSIITSASHLLIAILVR